jgi:hypothetical protein
MTGPTETLSEQRRKEIFAALVAAQDRGVPVAQSRQEVAAEYRVTAEQLAEIERDGMENEWPPL